MSLCAILLLTGCLPTPEVEVVPNKGELKTWQVEAKPYVQEEQAEAAAPAEAPAVLEQQGGPLYEILGATPTWSVENNDYGFSIVAQDCPVYLPDVSAVPVVEASRRDFRLLHVL
ncbi:MAG: hypothetical protein IIT86_12060 [Oscillospiraceae bacterium]|nr:hypothetical protein [Oscillospiraceae bacterium]